MSWRHRDILEAELHEPKGFTTANNGDSIWRNEQGLSEWTDREVLPAALNFVDASLAPPTTGNGDIYVLSLGASIHANWGTVALKDWVRYDGVAWKVITPSKSILCYDKTEDVLMSYDGSVWATVGSDTNIGNTDLTQTDQYRRYNFFGGNPTKLYFSGANSAVIYENGCDLELWDGTEDASNQVFRFHNSGGGTGNISMDNGGTTIVGNGSTLTLSGHATTTNLSRVVLGANIQLITSGTRDIKFQTRNIYFKNVAGLVDYGHISDDEFYWGATTPIGSEKFSIQVDTLVKGSDTSASTTGFKVTDVSNNTLIDIRNNSQISFGGAPVVNTAYSFYNPSNQVGSLASFYDNNGDLSIKLGREGRIETSKSGASVFKAYTQAGIGHIEVYSVFGQTLDLQNGQSWINSSSLTIGSTTTTTGTRFGIKQKNSIVSQQQFFGNITSTTAGILGSSGSFGADQKGFEVFDTTLNKKFIWNGSAWEQVGSSVNAGFTGTGNFTNFTIVDGVITNAT